jgi:magnesium transporter
VEGVTQSTASPEAILDRLRSAIDLRDAETARLLARRLLDDDASQLFEGLDRGEIRTLARLLGDETLADLLSQLDDHDAADILEQLPVEHAADVLEEIDPDDAADIIFRVDPDVSEDILVAMEPADAAEIRELMAYRPDTAGGIMTPEFVAMEPSLRTDRAGSPKKQRQSTTCTSRIQRTTCSGFFPCTGSCSAVRTQPSPS